MAKVRLKNVTDETIFLERYCFFEPHEEKEIDEDVLHRNKDGLWLVEGKLIEVVPPAPAAPPAAPETPEPTPLVAETGE